MIKQEFLEGYETACKLFQQGIDVLTKLQESGDTGRDLNVQKNQLIAPIRSFQNFTNLQIALNGPVMAVNMEQIEEVEPLPQLEAEPISNIETIENTELPQLEAVEVQQEQNFDANPKSKKNASVTN